MSQKRQYRFAQLAKFIGRCLTIAAEGHEEDIFATRDKKALLTLLDHLESKILNIYPARTNQIRLSKRYRNARARDELHRRIASGLRYDIERMEDGWRIPTGRIPWRVLDPDLGSFSNIVEHFDRLQSSQRYVEFDIQRLHNVYGLGPSQVYIGIDEFEGYVVFWFEEPQLAVLECPVVGNAAYVIRGRWRSLSKLSKTQLLKQHPEKVVRVVHSGEWLSRLKRVFK